MPAFVILDINIHEPGLMEAYKKLGQVTVATHGGKFIARGGEIVPLEGGWDPKRITIIEFPTLKQAKEWWNSKEYQEAIAIREKAATTKMIIVDGV